MIDIRNQDYLELLKSLPDNSVDLIVTDPPFGINYSNNFTKNKKEVLENDNSSFSYDLLANEAYRVLKFNRAFFAFTGWSTYSSHSFEVEEAGFQLKEPLIVQKRPSGTHDLYSTFQSNCDWILYATKGKFKFHRSRLLRNKKAGTIPNPGRKPVPEYKTRFPSCWFGNEFPDSTMNPSYLRERKINHPTVKNFVLIEWLIMLCTKEGDLVVDPFLGSGTTAIAAKNTNRDFIGCDISPEFVEISLRRLAEDR